MRTNLYRSYFVIVKFIGLVVFMGSVVTTAGENMYQKCAHFLMMALFLFTAVMLELSYDNRIKRAFLIGEGILSLLGVFLFPVTGTLFAIILLLDAISYLHGKIHWFFPVYGMLYLCYRNEMNLVVSFCILTFLILFYIQEKVIIERYRSVIDENEETEGILKTRMERSNRKFKEELQKSHLNFENQMLEERGRISQALHDKLGHSINGSVYKLEAAKLLIEKKPQECQKTIQEVIDNLRESMDEIRQILRRERPDKKRMALLSIQSLCEECEEKYHIHTTLNLSKESDSIPEKIWEIILDNIFEAVTNALKYAECKNIIITIIPMNQVVRCTIQDDGKGAATVEEGMGIDGMKKRVRSVQGFFDVETDLGVGFTINMVLPLNCR